MKENMPSIFTIAVRI